MLGDRVLNSLMKVLIHAKETVLADSIAGRQLFRNPPVPTMVTIKIGISQLAKALSSVAEAEFGAGRLNSKYNGQRIAPSSSG